MLWKWLPWKAIVSRVARAHGFMDPAALLARIQKIAQPSEVTAPLELIRAGISFHARGLINTKVIQQNLDWVWPYWVQRQFDPDDESFLPRAFSVTHVNLTHRNWTAVGLPGCDALPIVDPRGLLTPFFDGWSVDACYLSDDGTLTVPARARDADQQLILEPDDLRIRTACDSPDGGTLTAEAHVTGPAEPTCRVRYAVTGAKGGWLVVSIRPFNPEGVSFVESIELKKDTVWAIDGEPCVELSAKPDRHCVSDYSGGDVLAWLSQRKPKTEVHCPVGLATSAAMYRVGDSRAASAEVAIDLSCDEQSDPILPRGRADDWPTALSATCRFAAPDEKFQFLYDAAIRTLLLLSAADPVPGPYTYKRFWFRDAVLMLHAMLCVNMKRRVAVGIDRFRDRQSVSGFFHSQAGEWDSNGQVLWLLGRYTDLTGQPLSDKWDRPLRKGARWIARKRLTGHEEELHDGLLPAGFSAEHLGNNDYYYWDDFWAVAGLQQAERIARAGGNSEHADEYHREAEEMMSAIERSLERSRPIRGCDAIPASPHRRMDSGAIGSLCAGYPLHLLEPRDARLLGTADFLHANCRVHNAFFQDMIHSGNNAYLTLHLAQVLMRAGDERYWPLVQAIADLSSPTGQWPEAIHPRTGGGCMGDGQHGWAAADWVMMIRNMFLIEEGDTLVLGAGIPDHWRQAGQKCSLGPSPSRFGDVTVEITSTEDETSVQWKADWRRTPAEVVVALPGCEPQRCQPDAASATVGRRSCEATR